MSTGLCALYMDTFEQSLLPTFEKEERKDWSDWRSRGRAVGQKKKSLQEEKIEREGRCWHLDRLIEIAQYTVLPAA